MEDQETINKYIQAIKKLKQKNEKLSNEKVELKNLVKNLQCKMDEQKRKSEQENAQLQDQQRKLNIDDGQLKQILETNQRLKAEHEELKQKNMQQDNKLATLAEDQRQCFSLIPHRPFSSPQEFVEQLHQISQGDLPNDSEDLEGQISELRKERENLKKVQEEIRASEQALNSFLSDRSTNDSVTSENTPTFLRAMMFGKK